MLLCLNKDRLYLHYHYSNYPLIRKSLYKLNLKFIIFLINFLVIFQNLLNLLLDFNHLKIFSQLNYL
jgi:hypothetical protein